MRPIPPSQYLIPEGNETFETFRIYGNETFRTSFETVFETLIETR